MEQGASVIISVRNHKRLEEVKNQAANPDNVFIKAKELLEDIGGLSEWIKGIAKKYGKLKGLLPFAGVSNVRPLSTIDYESSLEVMNIHYFVPLMLIKGFADRRVNTGKNCSIVLMSSIGRYVGGKGHFEYAAAKAAIYTIAKNFANELFHKNIRVNSVSPGYVNTPLVTEAYKNGDITQDMTATYGEPEDIANVIVFLASAEAQWVNGEDIILDGGRNFPNVLSKF